MGQGERFVGKAGGWHEKGERFEGEAGGAGGSSCLYNTPKNYLTKIWGK